MAMPLDRALAAARAAPDVFLTVTGERARREADRLAPASGQEALYGATVSWKDMIALEGVVTTAGSKTRLNTPAAPEDAGVVRRAAAAGLITIGTTNLSEFAFSGIGQNPHFGTPLIAGRVPGGSSSGAAASVARGMVRLAVGTDTAGSCRVPAAFHGLFGFRPTRGRYPMTGVLPLAPDYDTVGLITCTARDLLDLDAILSGDADEPESAPRIWLDQYATARARSEVADAVRSAVEAAHRQGFAMAQKPRSLLSDAMDMIAQHGWPGGADAAALYDDLLQSEAVAQVDPLVAARLQRAARLSPDEMAKLRTSAADLRGRWPAPDTLIALPTVPFGAPLAEPLLSDPETYARINQQALSLTMPASLLDLPAVTLPVGQTAAGQWIGLQLVGAPHCDRALLMAACKLERDLELKGLCP
ncbi:amidase family protein [Sulfitobacter sp. PR48]|uniref:amidase family protein n=1 Tax=Sulfitobacter sp. PR48 TaxID=3028383 RepID=UPI00237BCE11|nr:amidase family protein [Sulfitobacter sp. PR48]MDD9720553.1 amidase family protein [Sulfitobacter sp. PR48]